MPLRNSTAWRLSGTPASRRGENAGADELRLRRQVVDRHELRTRPLAAHRQQVLAVLARRVGHERVRGIEDALARAEVLRQRDDLGLGAEAIGESQNVFDRGRAERVDSLRVVADHRDTLRHRACSAVRMSPCSLLVSWYSSTST